MNKDNINTSIIEHVSLARFRRRFTDWVTNWVISLFSNIVTTYDYSAGEPSVTVEFINGRFYFTFRGLKGEKGASVNIKPSANDCTQVGDAYIDSSTGIIWVLVDNSDPSDPQFQNAGVIKGADGSIWYTNSTMTGQIYYIPYNDDNTNYRTVDYHLNVLTGDVYKCASPASGAGTSSTWAHVGNIKGASGGKWYSSSETSCLLSTSTTNPVVGPSGTYAEGDYYLNTYNSNVYRCTQGGSSAMWLYQCNIKGGKGDQGTGLQFRWTGGGTYLEVKRTTDSSWQSSGYLKGSDGQPGRDGTIVSKAYRFMPSQGHLHAAGAALNGWEAYFDSRQIIADARITINERDMMANVHLTIMSCLDFQNHANFTSWYDWMEHFIDAYGMGDNWVGYVYGWLLPPNGNVNTDRVEFETKIPKNFWYGTMTIRHETSGPGQAPKAGMSPVELDLHGVLDLKTLKSEEIFDELFADGMSFSFALSSDLV